MLKLIFKSGLFWTNLNSPFVNHSKFFIKKQLNKKGLIALTHFKINFNKLTTVLSFFIKKNMKILFIDYSTLSKNIIANFTKNINQIFLHKKITPDVLTNFNGTWDRFNYLTKFLKRSYQNDVLNPTFKATFADSPNKYVKAISQEEKLLQAFNMSFFFEQAALNQFVDGVFFFSNNTKLKQQATATNYITFSFFDINTKINNEIYFLFGNRKSTEILMTFLFLVENTIKQKIILKNIIL